MSEKYCANCGHHAEGNFSIADKAENMFEGPDHDVDLCDLCGGLPLPTCETIWANIAKRRNKEATQ